MHVLIPGGAGYVGSKLVPALLNKGYKVTVLDLYIYGDVFSDISSNNLRQIKGDMRDIEICKKALEGCDCVIHLACISNDPSFELNPSLGKSINFDSFEPFVKLCVEKKIKRFLYASSSSVYGIKEEKNVTEDMELNPLTDYSKYKAQCEEILFKYLSDEFICTVLRPATVCGYAPRQRLDLVVNILTNLAYNTGKVKVMGGKQLRPNIHIEDMVRAYIHVLESDAKKVQGEIFNVGYDNYSVLDLASMVKEIISKKREVKLEHIFSDDHRSYHVNSDKIKNVLNFIPKKNIKDAILDLMNAFENNQLPNSLEENKYFNIKVMKKINLQ